MHKGETAAMLQTECFILAENDQHMMLAFRLDKAQVRENHRFLLAISESASNCPLRPIPDSPAVPPVNAALLAPAAPLSVVKARLWPARALVAGLLLSPAAMLANWAFSIATAPQVIALFAAPPPFETKQARILSPVINSGDHLLMEAQFRRTKDCQNYSNRVVMRLEDRVVVHRNEVRGFGASVGPHWQTSYYTVPLPHLDRGQYAYKVEIRTLCPGGEVAVHMQPELAFEVVEKVEEAKA